MTLESIIAKLAARYTEHGFTKEQAAKEMVDNKTSFTIAVQVLRAMK